MNQKTYLSKENVESIWELSLVQKEFFKRYEPGEKVNRHIIRTAFPINRDIDINQVREAWQQTVRQTPLLRTVFRTARNRTVQVILKEYPGGVEILDLSDPLPDSWLQDHEEEFNLMEEAAVKLKLVKRNGAISHFLLTCHPVVLEKQGLFSVFSDFMKIFVSLSRNEDPPSLRRPPFKNYLDWLARQYWVSAAAYWKKELASFPAPTSLKKYQHFDENDIRMNGYSRHRLSRELSAGLDGLCQQQGLCPSTVIQAAWALLLSIYSQEQEVYFGVELEGPPGGIEDIEALPRMIGPFANTLPLHVTINPGQSLRDFIKEIQEKNEYLRSYSYIPLEEIRANAQLETDTRLFESSVSVNLTTNSDLKPGENLPVDADLIPWSGTFPGDVESWQDRNHPFAIEVFTGEQWLLRFSDSENEFPEAAATRIIERLDTILAGIQKNPAARLSQLDYLSAREAEILRELNHPGIRLPDHCLETLMHKVFEQQAEKSPAATACTREDHQVSYHELNRRANRLCHWLREQGCGPGHLAGIFFQRGIDMLIAILAIFKAGGAYIPLDPGSPDSRVKTIITDSAVNVVFTLVPELERTRQLVNDLPLSPRVFCLEPLTRETSIPNTTVLDTYSPGNPLPVSRPSDLAYVLFTSGSTGVPKGAMIEHVGMLNHLWTKIRLLHLDHSTRLAQNASHCFDISVWQFLAALMQGGQTIIYSNEVAMTPPLFLESLRRHRVTVVEMVPAVIEMILAEGTGTDPAASPLLPDIRSMLSTGERFPTALCRRWQEKYPHITVVNAYGPTECSDDTHHRVVSPAHPLGNWDSDVPLGTIIPNFKGYILDSSLRPLPCGCPGEICLTGIGVGKGYLNNPELTAAVFPANPFADGMGQRMYRTGDRGYFHHTGQLVFLGRIDDQVKIRGHRIELGEIETRLSKHPAIKQCSAVIRKDSNQHDRIIAYVVLKEGTPTIELQDYLLAQLPAYMLPEHIIELETLPLTRSGKIDRKALPDPDPGQQTDPGIILPRTDPEKILASIWEEVLEISPIGIHHNFFQLGGHSLKVIQVRSRINRQFGVNISVMEVFQKQTIAELAQFIETRTSTGIDTYSLLQPHEKKEYYLLSSPQKRLYFLQQMDLQSTVYNLPFGAILQGKLQYLEVKNAFKRLIMRHESLRTSFVPVDEIPMQKIHPGVDFDIRYYDISHDNSYSEFIIQHSFLCPFDLADAPLIRVGLMKMNKREDKHVLLVDMHHIISDGVSHQMLLTEFNTLYQGKDPGPLRLQYKDFSQWQNRKEQRESLKRQQEYWLKQFDGEIPVLNLPTDYPRPAVQNFEGRTLRFQLQGQEAQKLAKIETEEEITGFMLILALYNIMLAKLSGQEDIIVGTDVAGRSHADLEHIVGMFVNTLAIRNFPTHTKTFKQFLQEVKTSTLKSLENQDYPFEDLVELVSLDREISRNPMFDVLFSFDNIIDPGNKPAENRQEQNPPGFIVSPYMGESITRTAKFDLTLNGDQQEDLFFFSFEYSTKLFKEKTIQRFITYFRQVTAAVSDNVNREISQIEIISPQEKNQVLLEFNRTGKPIIRDKSYEQLFREQAGKEPDKIAAVHNNRHITYKELDHRSRRIAGVLTGYGTVPNQVVPLYLQRGIKMLVSIIGIFKTGSAYLPLEIHYPASRLEYILHDSQAHIIISEESHREVVENLRASCPSLKEIVWLDQLPGDEREILQQPNQKDRLVYLIYTSGTTGSPKGVMIHQLGMTNHLFAKINDLSITWKDIIAQTASACFDISVWQFLSALLTGGRTVIIDRETVLEPGRLLAVLRQEKISILELVPSLINVFLEAAAREPDKDKELKHLRWMVATGETLAPALARQWFRHYPGKALLNAYGPTEASDDITHYRVEPAALDSQNPVPIGKPIQNTHVYILDNNLLPCPIGVRGEICTSGLGVGPGYHRDPAKTKAAFVPNPYIDIIGDNDYAALYKTGDIGFYREDGNIEFIGRLDHQVKIRGYRIELAEIENRLLNYPSIKEAVVIVKNAGDDKYLCAYIVSEEEFDSAALKHQLLNELPDYMVPSYYVFLDKMPLTTSGKIDRKSLPPPQFSPAGEYTPPRNEIEEKLAEIWADILFIEKSVIGIDSNFFEAGGHSLKAVQMVSRIHKVFNVRLPLPEIFRTPTIRGLSEYIKSADRQHFAPIKPMEEKEYYVLSSPQARFYLLQQLNRESTTYNMSLPMPLDPSYREQPLEMIFKRLIRRHESLRTSFRLIKNEPRQLIHREVDFKIDHIQTPAKHKVKIIEEYIKPFDLSIPPLFRVALIKAGSQKTLVVDMHHIISDGISLQVLTKEFMALYEEQQLTPLFLQYKDYASWQKHLIETGIYKKMEKFWLDTLENFNLSKLPEDRTAHTDSPRARGEIKTALIDKDTYLNLEEFCRKYTLTKFSFMFSIFTFVLAKEIGSHDISLGAPVANREHSDLENMIGVFLNVILLRANIDKGDTVLNNLLKINRDVVNALENSTYPYEELFYRVKNKYHLTNDELFTILFNYLPADEEEPAARSSSQLPAPTGLPLEITPKYNVTVYLADNRQQMSVNIVYNSHLYHPGRMERIASNYLRLIETVLADEHIPIEALNYEDEASTGSLPELAGEFDTEDLW